MAQALRAHLLAAGLRYHLIVFINDIYPFCACQIVLFRHQETLLLKRSCGASLRLGVNYGLIATSAIT